jgi:hypothetical protein
MKTKWREMTEKPDFIKIMEEYFEKNKPPTLYKLIWEEVGKKVGYGIDCDVMTDRLVDIVAGWLPKESEGFIDVLQWNKCVRRMKETLR